ncbi:hypothetical protein KP509_02G115200 [Ceratopteris richardii]|uniref:Uncharacterized protein n=1 Tax=Ceratopteris richardii TaxID=49495 RepID=A0A8T2VHZ1_CERRI|nr:hypothetical protein KP509_02G115200 [Ceratopteris richardii]
MELFANTRYYSRFLTKPLTVSYSNRQAPFSTSCNTGSFHMQVFICEFLPTPNLGGAIKDNTDTTPLSAACSLVCASSFLFKWTSENSKGSKCTFSSTTIPF